MFRVFCSFPFLWMPSDNDELCFRRGEKSSLLSRPKRERDRNTNRKVWIDVKRAFAFPAEKVTETVSRRKKCLLSVCLEERKKGEERHRKRETDPSLTFAGERKRKKISTEARGAFECQQQKRRDTWVSLSIPNVEGCCLFPHGRSTLKSVGTSFSSPEIRGGEEKRNIPDGRRRRKRFIPGLVPSLLLPSRNNHISIPTR